MMPKNSGDYLSYVKNIRRYQLLALLDLELDRALSLHGPMHSGHEGWAVIREELDELWEHVRGDTTHSLAAASEAIEVAAMALRFAFDLANDFPIPDTEDDLKTYLERFKTFHRAAK